jgi:putative peptide zinc metalloprotease protein
VAETLTEAGQQLTVIRSPSGNYLRLTTAEREIWEAMDGQRSIAELATLGFLQFKQLLPVADLVHNLYQSGFLTDRPVGLYRGLRERVQHARWERWGRKVLATLRTHTFPIPGVGSFIDGLYRAGGRWLFSLPFAVIFVLVVLVGLRQFTTIFGDTYRIFDATNPVSGVLAFWAALLTSFLVHELAHGLAVKRFGRRVLHGGVMIYYGMPAAYVDTSDIWLAGRRARIAVSLAGPLCDLFVGSLAAIVAAQLAPGELGGAAYRLSIAAYLAALFNFNPLLELDGYFILVDWLRLPNLRRRALQFISGPFWEKLRTRSAFTANERIFTLYGGLSAAYTLLAIVLVAVFWQQRIAVLLRDLWAGGWLGQIIVLLIIVAVLVPLGLGLLVALWGGLRAAASWVQQRELARNPALVAFVLTGLAFVLASLPLRHTAEPMLALIVPLFWLLALISQVGLHQDYRGATLANAIDSFLAVTAIELLAQTGYLLIPGQAPLWAGLELVAFSLLMYAGFVAMLDVDLQRSQAWELGVTALMLGGAFLAGGLAIGVLRAAMPEAQFAVTVLAAAPIYFSVVTLALLVPLLAGMRDSRLFWSWLVLWLGIAVQSLNYLLEALPQSRNQPSALAVQILAAGLWAAAWQAQLISLREPPRRHLRWPFEPALGEVERLQRAFRHCYAGCYLLLRDQYGARRAALLDDRMDVLAATANWNVTLDRETARIGATLAAAPIDKQGQRYAEVLRYTVTTIERIAGSAFARRVIQVAYDALPWAEREAAGRRSFAGAAWARHLSRRFGDERTARIRLLRQVELFDVCDDNELRELAAALEPLRVPAGTRILATGEAPQGLWIVEAGEILRREGATVLEELHRGMFFGAVGSTVDTASGYRSSVASELLYLPPEELRRMLTDAAPHTSDGVVLFERMRLLERIPLFADLSRTTLRALAREAERMHAPPRKVLVAQGRPNGALYVVETGRVAVVRRDGNSQAAPRVVARLGPAEFFGELELLRDSPPVASVVSIADTYVLRIPHTRIAGLLTGTTSLAANLEQIGSGRLYELRVHGS